MIEFFEKAGNSGRLKPSMASTLAAAAKRVLQIEGGWEQIDISQLDVEEFWDRFRNLRGLEYKQDSIIEYERRFKRAVGMFLDYTRNPATWRYSEPPSGSRNGTPPRKDSSKRPAQKRTVETTIDSDAEHASGTGNGAQAQGNMVEYPFPLREGCIVRLRLPVDLKIAEVERLAAFMRTIAADFTSNN
jgi:hypothetical protein